MSLSICCLSFIWIRNVSEINAVMYQKNTTINECIAAVPTYKSMANYILTRCVLNAYESNSTPTVHWL